MIALAGCGDFCGRAVCRGMSRSASGRPTIDVYPPVTAMRRAFLDDRCFW
jgi:hypothetical protein